MRFDNQPEQSLEDCYKKMLTKLNASSGSTNKIARFLMGLSLRVQIRILTLWKLVLKREEETRLVIYRNGLYRADNYNDVQKYMVDGLMDIFSSDIYQIAKNAKNLIQGDNLYSAHMLSLLVSNNCLDSETSFMPETEDDTLNKVLLAVGIKMDQYLNMPYGKYMVFDFWLRICYMKFLVRKIGGREYDNNNESDLLKFSGISSDTGLIKAIGLSQAYLNSYLNVYDDFDTRIMPGTIYLGNKIPDVLLDTNQSMPILPLLGTVNDRNEEKVFVSIYRLFSTLSEFMRSVKFDPHNKDAYYVSMLKKLAQYRNFIEKNSGFINDDTQKKKGFDSFSMKEESLLNKIAANLKIWCNNDTQVSVQQLDRIFTRFYYTLINIEKSDDYDNVGDKFNAIICALINASLVEEALEKYNTRISIINYGNIERILISNLSELRKNKQSIGMFTSWLMKCPLLNCYMNPIISHLLQLKESERVMEMEDVLIYGNDINNLKILHQAKRNVQNTLLQYEKNMQLLHKILMWTQEKNSIDFDKKLLNDKFKEIHKEEIMKLQEKIIQKEQDLNTIRLKLKPSFYQYGENNEKITLSSSSDDIFKAIDYTEMKNAHIEGELDILNLRIGEIEKKVARNSPLIRKIHSEIIEKSKAEQSIYNYFKEIPLTKQN